MNNQIRTKESMRASQYAISIALFALCYVLVSLICHAESLASGTLIHDWKAAPHNFLYVQLSLALLFIIAYGYFYYESLGVLVRKSKTVMMLSIVVVSYALNWLVGRFVGHMARPFAVAALLTLALSKRKDAIFMNSLVCLITFLCDTFLEGMTADTELFTAVIMDFVSGLLAIYLATGMRSRVKTVFLGLILAVPPMVTGYLLSGFSAESLLKNCLFGITSGMGSVVAYNALLPVFESVFNVITNYRLYEITDHSSPLLRRLIAEAPGTYNHCMVVATLCEACAAAIGENPELARAAAYYHDVGKLANPTFFTENQEGVNPHDALDPELSTNIIRDHAKQGRELIEKYRLPAFFGDVACQHHGTLPIRYFYNRAQKLTDGHLDIKKFCYHGPTPQTKIAAIVMICDAAEAISRTLKDRSRTAVDEQVKKVIEERLELAQFNECPITLAELYAIRKTIVENVGVVYHSRVEYPKFAFSQQTIKEVEELTETVEEGEEK